MAKKTITASSGGFFFPLLCVLFIGLKLSGNIDWSWWLVLAPVLWPLYFVAALIVAAAVIAAFLAIAEALS